jgi:hypothetical protein
LDYSGRMTGGSGVDLLLRFCLNREVDRTKCCQKINQRQQGCLGFMGRKCDTTQWRGDVDWRKGDTGEGRHMLL